MHGKLVYYSILPLNYMYLGWLVFILINSRVCNKCKIIKALVVVGI